MWTQIVSKSFTSVSSVSVDNCFSADYSHYEVFVNATSTVDGNGGQIRLRSGGTDATGTDYRRIYLVATDTTKAAGRVTGDTAFSNPAGSFSTTLNMQNLIKISNPYEATRTTLLRVSNHANPGTDEPIVVFDIFAHDLSTSYDGFTLINAQGGGGSTGVITGTVTVYGLRES